jgi:hypothetical protein
MKKNRLHIKTFLEAGNEKELGGSSSCLSASPFIVERQ